MKTIESDYEICIKKPVRDGDGNSSTTTIATVRRGKQSVARFTGIHALKQAEAWVTLAESGATEASLAQCVADVGRAAVHERSLKDHPILLEVEV